MEEKTYPRGRAFHSYPMGHALSARPPRIFDFSSDFQNIIFLHFLVCCRASTIPLPDMIKEAFLFLFLFAQFDQGDGHPPPLFEHESEQYPQE